MEDAEVVLGKENSVQECGAQTVRIAKERENKLTEYAQQDATQVEQFFQNTRGP